MSHIRKSHVAHLKCAAVGVPKEPPFQQFARVFHATPCAPFAWLIILLAKLTILLLAKLTILLLAKLTILLLAKPTYVLSHCMGDLEGFAPQACWGEGALCVCQSRGVREFARDVYL